MTKIPIEQVKKLLIANGGLASLIELYNLYRKETDKPDFADFMSWLTQ